MNRRGFVWRVLGVVAAAIGVRMVPPTLTFKNIPLIFDAQPPVRYYKIRWKDARTGADLYRDGRLPFSLNGVIESATTPSVTVQRATFQFWTQDSGPRRS